MSSLLFHDLSFNIFVGITIRFKTLEFWQSGKKLCLIRCECKGCYTVSWHRGNAKISSYSINFLCYCAFVKDLPIYHFSVTRECNTFLSFLALLIILKIRCSVELYIYYALEFCIVLAAETTVSFIYLFFSLFILLIVYTHICTLHHYLPPKVLPPP